MSDEIEYKTKLFTKQKLWAIILSIVGIFVAIAIYIIRANQKPVATTPPPAVANTEAKISAVTALGRLEPVGEVIQLSPPPSLGGSKVEQLLVKEGDFVEAKQAIAVLDRYDRALAEVESAKQDIKVAEADLAIVKAGAKQGEIEAQKAIIERKQAQLEGEIATDRAKIARLEAQLQTETEAQRATISRRQAELRNAKLEFKRYQQLASDGAISDSELDLRRLNFETAIEQVTEAKANLNRSRHTLSEEIKEAKAAAQKTEYTLDKEIIEAKANLDRIAEVRTVDLEKARAELDKAIAAHQQAKEELELTYVRAPIKSQVLKIHSHPGESVDLEKGIAELGQTAQMIAVAEVYESDIGKVRLGQQASIISESGVFEGELQGKVSQVGLQIGKKDVLDTDPAADVDARVVEVKILLDEEDSNTVASLTYSKVIVKILL